jgi:hypothetical protein
LIQNLSIRLATLKQLQEVVRNTLEHIGMGNIFLNRNISAQYLTERRNKWYCIKLKRFCTPKETLIKLSDSPKNGRKSLPARD